MLQFYSLSPIFHRYLGWSWHYEASTCMVQEVECEVIQWEYTYMNSNYTQHNFSHTEKYLCWDQTVDFQFLWDQMLSSTQLTVSELLLSLIYLHQQGMNLLCIIQVLYLVQWCNQPIHGMMQLHYKVSIHGRYSWIKKPRMDIHTYIHIYININIGCTAK